ncbi:neurofilament heavy polypeptide-like [Spodoptera litura]|uniref:Neurofilament heavy polypeptide-like n=1 Tax=Spodoptera litura TaxID=69820 RepID=A0A9J7DV12_SPOLT|nr:neurofilament heavy polypeptide-like [Spodoptera litura]
MGPCCVEGCEITNEETFYFEFPTSRTLRRKWLELIPIPGKLLLGTVVCSRHFSTTDYENVRGKVRLKSKVVPSLLLDVKKTPPNDKPPNEITSTAPTKEDKQKSPSPAKSPIKAKSPSPVKELTKSHTEQDSSPTEKNKSLTKRARTSIQQDKARTPIKRDRSSKERDRSPTQRDRSPTQQDRSPTHGDRSPTQRDVSPTERDRSPIQPQKSRTPSPTQPETCEVPSLVDAEKMIDDLQREALSNKTKVGNKQNGVSNDRVAVVQSAPTAPPAPPPPPIDHKEDIEDMITNYHIKNKVPNPALLADLAPVETDPQPQASETIEIEDAKEAEPVFIELSVGKDGSAVGGGNEDCLMVLESVQVDVDPSTLLLAHDDDYYRDEDESKDENRKDDPISLLTSSDEDDVILQEPHIDTVEVSDETDEDDKPLVTLVKNKPTKKMKVLKKKSKDRRKFRWSMCDFYCVQCHYSTNNSLDYNKHLSTHSTVLQVCSICSYTSASKSNFARHTRNHKVEKKFKCHLCEYKARHKMSLIYHLKSHDPQEINATSTLDNFICKNCNFKSRDKVKIFGHLQNCDRIKRHCCDNCDYVTKKRSDLKRHRARKHPEECDDDDMEYVPKSNGDKTAVRLVE